MPRQGGSITSIQAHVTNARLGYGKTNKKRKLCDEGLFDRRSLKVQSPRLGGMKLVQQSQNV